MKYIQTESLLHDEKETDDILHNEYRQNSKGHLCTDHKHKDHVNISFNSP